MDIRQSNKYAYFMTKIGWQVKKINRHFIFIRNIPFLGKFAKCLRITPPIPFKEINQLLKKEKIKKIIIEPQSPPDKSLIQQFLKNGYQPNHSPFTPTKTILIDLTKKEAEIFSHFQAVKRRSIRKAIKKGVIVYQSQQLESFIKLKTVGFFPLSFWVAKQIRLLWQAFSPYQTCLLLASSDKSKPDQTEAGVLLLFFGQKAYYWLAASTQQGNQLAAPSLLVWEALKTAKKKGCCVFDFEGIYDPCYHQATKNWQGFTRFKQDFGGQEITFFGSWQKKN